jgi:hypothetical protein
MFDLSNGALKPIRPTGLVGARGGTRGGIANQSGALQKPSLGRSSGMPEGRRLFLPALAQRGRAIRAGKTPSVWLNFAPTSLLGSLA